MASYHQTLVTYLDGTSLVLTTDSPASHYGLPVLRHEGCDKCADMGPADVIPLCAEPQNVRDLFGPRSARDVVATWASEQQTEADRFLSQAGS